MAKNHNSVSFTVLLLVLLVASTGFLKSEALNCGNAVCPTAADRVFHGECGAEPFLGTDADCCDCCKSTYDVSKLCWAIVEGTDRHCHCYYKKV